MKEMQVMVKVPQDRAAELALVIGMMGGNEMPLIDPDLFFDSKYREAWNAGLKVVADGKDPTMTMIAQYADSSILSASDLVSMEDQWRIPVTNMEIYATAVRGCAAQREALAVALAIEETIIAEPSEYSKPLELAVERCKEALMVLDQGNVPTNRSAMERWVDEQEGVFDQKQLYADLGLRTKKQKDNARATMHRLVKEDVIERVKKKGSGWYRKRDIIEEEIDFLNVTDETIDLKLPFKLHKMFTARPKNIIVIAGEPDAGKSAVALQIAKMNQGGPLPIKYMSSEMGPNEFRSRLDRFEDQTGEDYMAIEHWEMKVTERSEDFHDVLLPDGLNIIDFLEIHEDFWAVGQMLKDIFDKLDRGICIVCIQKTNTVSHYGLGGLRGMEKPRLYLSLRNGPAYHTMKIVKCKAPRHPDEMNPTGLELNFKVVAGCRLDPVNPSANGQYWHRPDEEREREDDNCFRSRA
jgi:replicative DNA helicase